MTKKALPNIFAYVDFRKYLIDWQYEAQQVNPEMTRSKICELLGLPNSRSYFRDVAEGKIVSPIFVGRFLTVLQLNKQETQYFKTLVKYDQSTEPDEKELYLEQLIALNQTPKLVLDKSTFEYFRHWYYPAILNLLEIVDFKDNYNDLARELIPSVTPKEAQQAIATLKTLNLIKKNEKGFWKQSQKTLATNELLQDSLILQYQDQCLSLARTALFRKEKAPKRIYTSTLNISETAYKRIEKYLDKFRAEVRSVAHKDEEKADRVYQLNMELFPLARLQKRANA